MTSTTLRRCLPTLLSSAAASSSSASSSSTLIRRTPGSLALPLATAAAAARGGAVAAFTTTLPRRGLEEFFDPTRAPHEPVQVGRAWTADELRRKSFSDLHKLWYVLYKERNVLLTEEASCKRNRVTLPSPHRKTLVRKSMARIKLVLKERQLQQQQQEQQQQQQGGQGQQLQQEQQKEQQ